MNLDFLAKMYANAVEQGNRTIDSVPDVIKEKVENILKENKNNA